MTKQYTFDDLTEIIARLRGENGCPWDKEQTRESMKQYVLEESMEVIDVCGEGGLKLADELGDLLLQIMLLSQISKEEGSFTINDVINCICKKMIRRHPHVFGSAYAATADDVLSSWNKIKKEERSQSTYTDALKSVTKTLPSLIKAYKVQEKAADAGFDWDNVNGAFEKINEELNEVKAAVAARDKQCIYDEMGDLLFSVVNAARFFNVNPEFALNDTTAKFISRFEFIEKAAALDGKSLNDMNLSEMDKYWDKAKQLERTNNTPHTL